MIDPGRPFTPAGDGPEGEDLEEIVAPRNPPANVQKGAVSRLNCKQGHLPPKPNKTRSKREAKKKGKVRVGGDSRPGKAGTVGKETRRPTRPKKRSGRKGKTHPPLSPFAPITRLSLTDDRLDVLATLPTGPLDSPHGSHASPYNRPGTIYRSPEGQPLTFGPYTLQPARYGRGWYRRLYAVYHRQHSDPVATLSTHPKDGPAGRCEIHVENHLHYTGEAVGLLIGLLDEIGATEEEIKHWEIQATSPRLSEIPDYIDANQLTRRNGGKWHTRNYRDHNGRVNDGMHVGVSSSARYAVLYHNGKELDRRNRLYIARRTEADGVSTPNQVKQLARLEWNLRGKEVRRLTYTDKDGNEQPVTVRSLVDPAVRLAVYRAQIETGFVFRKRIGKDRYAVAQFFDWQQIEPHYLENKRCRVAGTGQATAAPSATTVTRERIHARKSNATYGAKQTVKKLLHDGRKGDYLALALRPHIERTSRAAMLRPDRLQALTDTLAGAGCEVPPQLVTELLRAFAEDAAAVVADQLSHAVPEATARAVAEEHGITDYLRRQLHPARALPAVQRLPSSVKRLKPVGHGRL